MKKNRIIYILFLGTVLGCRQLGMALNPYHNLGSFNSRIEAQNRAIADILKNYGSLPTDRYYKVKYANARALPTELRENALWYNKSEEKLVLEVDIDSVPACSWEKVNKTTLEQAIKSQDGMLKIDSLAKPNQPTSQCLK